MIKSKKWKKVSKLLLDPLFRFYGCQYGYGRGTNFAHSAKAVRDAKPEGLLTDITTDQPLPPPFIR